MKILVLAPHADDETLGMGGTIKKLSSAGHDIFVAVLTGHGETPHPIWPEATWDIVRNESKKACSHLGVKELIFKNLPAACLDHHPAWEVNKIISDIIISINPEEIYIPYDYDLHKDHNAISYAANVATRPYLKENKNIKRILAYEILSETNLSHPYMKPAFHPNVYIDISSTIQDKISAFKYYSSQNQSDDMPRSESSIKALARLRGSSIGAKYAEGFYLVGEYMR